MPSSLAHSQAQILRKALIQLGLAADGESQYTAGRYVGDAWPVTAHKEADAPSNVVTTYATTNRVEGRNQVDGTLFEKLGVMIRVRSETEEVGWVKANAIREGVARRDLCYNVAVTLDSTNYLLESLVQIGPILVAGDNRVSNRKVFTINALANVRQLN